LTAAELRTGYAAGRFTPVDVVDAIVERVRALEPLVNAFEDMDLERARRLAVQSWRRWRTGTVFSPFDGIPITVKDTLHAAGFPTRHGSWTTPEAAQTESCPAVQRLEDGGAVVLGKTATSEFAWKPVGDSPLTGVTRNPWDLERTSGGSSSGAAAGTAVGFGVLAISTDAGGSTRIPASYCGVFGLKPTFGRVPHAPHGGLFGNVSSIGLISRCVDDAADALQLITQPDRRDWSSPIMPPFEAASARLGDRPIRVALALDLAEAELSDEVRAAVVSAVRDPRLALALSIGEVASPIPPLEPDYRALWAAGMARKVAAVAPAHRSSLDPELLEAARQGEGVGLDEVLKAQAGQVALGGVLAALFETWDVLITPTAPSSPPAAGGSYLALDRWRALTPYTYPFNLCGLPAASVPIGLLSDGLPLGLQIVGPRFTEGRVLAVARAIETVFPPLRPALIERAANSPCATGDLYA
jgi:aspartyl-tRNA(Asn)/glutamyl-tRNA(Gln) amidotransferase subunit A